MFETEIGQSTAMMKKLKSIEQVNYAGAHDWFNLGFAVKSIILRTQILNKWDNGQKSENEKFWFEKLEKQVN